MFKITDSTVAIPRIKFTDTASVISVLIKYRYYFHINCTKLLQCNIIYQLSGLSMFHTFVQTFVESNFSFSKLAGIVGTLPEYSK